MIDWREWMFAKLDGTTGASDRVYSTLEEAPEEKPFIVIRMGTETIEVHESEGAVSTNCVLWIHDSPGSYENIDAVIEQIRGIVDSDSLPDEDGVTAIYQGKSQDLADDMRGTVMKNLSYRLIGRR